MASSRKSPKNSPLPARVGALVRQHVQRDARLVVGLSGGIDSVVLLDLMQRAARSGAFTLAAVHVNHQISPHAAAWTSHCRVLCRRLGVPLTVRKVSVKKGNSLEAAARHARYAVYGALKADAVVLAHNQDDQAETLLLQLLRGSGVKGAAAMPVFRAGQAQSGGAALLRPLLDVPRSEIEAYARRRKLAWCEDESNRDTDFDRNFLRHRVLPVVAERFPAYRRTLARASSHFAEALELSAALAAADAASAAGALNLPQLRGLSSVRLKNVLRHFIAAHGVLMPVARRLDECVRQLQAPRGAMRLRLALGSHELRRSGDRLLLVPLTAGRAEAGPGRVELHWLGERRLPLPEFGGVLSMTLRRGQGLSLAALAGKTVTLRLRQGGEKLRLDPARPRRTLKNLCQELRIPEWERPRLPLMYVGEELAWVAGVGIDVAFQAGIGAAGVVPGWRAVTP